MYCCGSMFNDPCWGDPRIVGICSEVLTAPSSPHRFGPLSLLCIEKSGCSRRFWGDGALSEACCTDKLFNCRNSYRALNPKGPMTQIIGF